MPKSKKPFKKAYLEITSQCNLDCSFCPKTSRPPQFITVEQFDYLLGQVQPLTDFVYLHLMGEPLLHPQLDRLLELCAQRELKVSLTTNGTLLHRWQQQLLQSPALYRVSISLHSFEANRTGQSLEEYLSKAAWNSAAQPVTWTAPTVCCACGTKTAPYSRQKTSAMWTSSSRCAAFSACRRTRKNCWKQRQASSCAGGSILRWQKNLHGRTSSAPTRPTRCSAMDCETNSACWSTAPSFPAAWTATEISRWETSISSRWQKF